MDSTLLSAPEALLQPGSVITELLAEGVSREDIDLALALQRTQRQARVPVLPLRAICGRADPQSGPSAFHVATSAAARLHETRAPRRRRTGGLHITRRPVLAGSVQTETTAEQQFVRPLSDRERKRIASASYRTFRRAKQLAAECRAGTRELNEHERKLIGFTSSCRDILLRLLDDAAFRKGWCVPAYETIMRWTSLSRSTVHRSLRVLADIGFIEWIRRFIYSKDPEIGARSEQTSNLYRFALPNWLGKLIGLPSPPPPDDELQRRENADEETAVMLASLSPAERARMMPTDEARRASLIAAALRADQRAAAFAQTRECQKHTPPLHENYLIRGEKWNRPSRPMSQP